MPSPGPDNDRASRRVALAFGGVLVLAMLVVVAFTQEIGPLGDDEEPAVEVVPGCEQVEQPPPKDVSLKPPEERVAPGERITATVETSCGAFEIALDSAGSPKTVSSFVHLVEEGLYEETTFNRVVPGFLIQGGDPTQDRTGDPGYTVDEPPRRDTEYTRGTVAMAKTSAEPPGRSGSQFFVVTAADAGLPPSYAVLGEVSAGVKVVDRIGSLADPNLGPEGGEPRVPVVIETITLG